MALMSDIVHVAVEGNDRSFVCKRNWSVSEVEEKIREEYGFQNGALKCDGCALRNNELMSIAGEYQFVGVTTVTSSKTERIKVFRCSLKFFSYKFSIQLGKRVDDHTIASALTSGHVSVADGGISPLVGDDTVTFDVPVIASHDPLGSKRRNALYYLTLWSKDLKRKNNGWKMSADVHVRKFCFSHNGGWPALWLPSANSNSVRHWYICFRLCNDDIPTFIEYLRENFV